MYAAYINDDAVWVSSNAAYILHCAAQAAREAMKRPEGSDARRDYVQAAFMLAAIAKSAGVIYGYRLNSPRVGWAWREANQLIGDD